MRKRVALAVLLLSVVGVAACGDDEPAQPALEVPTWAKVAPEQIAEATKHGVPVAFENDLGMRFVLVPAGTFWMGIPGGRGALSGLHDVGEVHREVTLTRPFYVQTHVVSAASFAAFRSPETDVVEGPATDISWNDAHAFATWLSERDASRDYRLPTDAEWEYVSRAGADAARAGGVLMPDGSAVKPVDPAAAQPHPWGLHGVLDEVYEWCGDWSDNLERSPVEDPSGPERGTHKVLRGGTSTARRAIGPAYGGPIGRHRSGIGFRLVSPVPDPEGGA